MSSVTTLRPKSRDFTWPGCNHPADEDGGVCLHLWDVRGAEQDSPVPHEPCNRREQHARTCPWVTGLTYHEAMNASTNHDDHDNPIPGCFACDRLMNEDVAVDR